MAFVLQGRSAMLRKVQFLPVYIILMLGVVILGALLAMIGLFLDYSYHSILLPIGLLLSLLATLSLVIAAIRYPGK